LKRAMGALAVMALLVALMARTTAGAEVVYRCFGVPATIVGTVSDDTLIGTDGPDVIVGLEGNDYIRGNAGDDLICGGPGNDSSSTPYYEADVPGLDAGAGDDKVSGGPGDDDVNGNEGSDYLVGGAGHDLVADAWSYHYYGGAEAAGDDVLLGGKGPDRLLSTGGNDESHGGPGDDCIGGETLWGCFESAHDDLTDYGNDTYFGGRGDDRFDVADGTDGNDSLQGGDHYLGDVCSADPGDSVASCER
jgi:Ca2+-binding RTX toxin-like protein